MFAPRTSSTIEIMTVLAPLVHQPPEPLSKLALDRIRTRIRANGNGSITIDKNDVDHLINEILWLKRRPHRVETAIAPLVDDLRKGHRRS